MTNLQNTHKGPVYVIFGAAGGIGTALCQHLHAQGARLFLAGRNRERLQALSSKLGDAPFCTCDATQSAEVNAVFDAAIKAHGEIHAVANLVGSLALKPTHLTSDDDFFSALAINTHSAFFIVRAAIKPLQAQGGGTIVLMSSVAAEMGLPNHEAIASAKAAVAGLVRSAAATYAGHNIRINGVAPGLTTTPLTAGITESTAVAKASAAMHPLGRFSKPEDVARTVAFLLDPAHDAITGQVWGVDGGLAKVHSTRRP